MRKVLIHAGMSPLEQPELDEVFSRRLFTTNSGNLLFQYGVYRAMMTEDTEFITRFLDRGDLSEAFIERVNAECECVVLPMANNFRAGYDLMPNLTAFVKQLRIPCVVTGIGLQADSAEDIRHGFPFDDRVRDFISAVLDHSAMLGLRGEFTADYLSRLGFIPERHFTVTGCPSMYSRGSKLPEVRREPLTAASGICVNYRKEQPLNLFHMVDRATQDYSNYHLLFQRVEEMFMLRYGMPVMYDYRRHMDDESLYPTNRSHPAVRNQRAIGFANARAWMDFMGENQFSFGCRIHGNIAAVLSGTPALVFTIDTRTEELCRYHHIPFIPASQIEEATDLRVIYESTDFSDVHVGHEARFQHFVDFLNANGLRHAYSDSLTPERVPFDDALAKLPEWGLISAPKRMPPTMRLRGVRVYWPTLQKKIQGKLKYIARKMKR